MSESSQPKWIAFVAIIPYEERDQVKLSEHSRHISQTCEKPTAEQFDKLVGYFVDRNFWGVFS